MRGEEGGGVVTLSEAKGPTLKSEFRPLPVALRAPSRVTSCYSSLLTSHFSLLTSHSSLLTPYFSLLTSHSLLLTPYFSPLTSHPLLLTPYCLLLTAYCSLQLSRLPHPGQPPLCLLDKRSQRLVGRLPLAQHLAVFLPGLGPPAELLIGRRAEQPHPAEHAPT